MGKKIIILFVLFVIVGCDDSGKKEKISSLSWLSAIFPDTVPALESITTKVVCLSSVDTDVTVSFDDTDSCGAEISPLEDGSWEYKFVSGDENLSCNVSIKCTNGLDEIFYEHHIDFTSELDISDYTFSSWELFDRPVDDYIQTNSEVLGHSYFRQSISDLTVFDSRLYIGYGDADLNLGRNTPIEIRAYSSLDASSLQTEFVTDEEEVSLYRIVNSTLVIPGVDATEDNLIGNSYILGSEWIKNRTLEWAWHVHDITYFKGNYYSCGSGGSLDDYNNSTVRSFVWNSSDGNEAWSVVFDNPHSQPPGDNRFTHLMPAGDILYVFGYLSAENTTYSQYYTFDGTSFSSMEEPPSFFIFNTWMKDTVQEGFAAGVYIEDPLRWGVMRWSEDGFTKVESLNGVSVIDMFLLPDGRALIAYIDGDEYPTPDSATGEFFVGLLNTDGSFDSVFHKTSTSEIVSIAWFNKSLLLGMDDGSIMIAGKSY